MAKIILFVDALDEDDLSGRMTETWDGYIESGAPKVTPKVTGEVYTGQSPSQQGMGRVHSMKGDKPSRPHAPMVMEKLEALGYDVMSVFMPYALPTNLQNGAWIAEAMGNSGGGQHPLMAAVNQPPAAGDLMDPADDGEMAFNARVDELYGRISAVLNAIRAANFDVVFIGIRSPDQYTHFQHGEKWRGMLCEDIAHEVRRMEENHEVLWWSDHGNETKKETFRVNRWLIEKGYLDVDIDLEFADRFAEEMKEINPRAGGRPNIENQLGIHTPGVELNGGAVVSADPYDGSLDRLPDAEDDEVEDAIEELRETGKYEYLVPTVEEWGEGQYLDECPDFVGLRADNVLVTGNVHPDPIGMGFMRDGVHSKYGVFGCTGDLDTPEMLTPRSLHDVILKFVTGTSPSEVQAKQEIGRLEQQFEAALAD